MHDQDFIVCYRDSGKDEIQRELQKLDKSLYLDQELDYPGGPIFYVVKHHIGSGHPPVSVLEWKNGDGTPRPLTYGIVEQVKRQEGALDGMVPRMLHDLAERKQQDRERSRAQQEAITAEHLPRLKAAEGRTLPPNWRPRRFGAS